MQKQKYTEQRERQSERRKWKKKKTKWICVVSSCGTSTLIEFLVRSRSRSHLHRLAQSSEQFAVCESFARFKWWCCIIRKFSHNRQKRHSVEFFMIDSLEWMCRSSCYWIWSLSQHEKKRIEEKQIISSTAAAVVVAYSSEISETKKEFLLCQIANSITYVMRVMEFIRLQILFVRIYVCVQFFDISFSIRAIAQPLNIPNSNMAKGDVALFFLSSSVVSFRGASDRKSNGSGSVLGALVQSCYYSHVNTRHKRIWMLSAERKCIPWY